MSKGKELLAKAKKDIIIDVEASTVEELKARLIEIVETKKTLSMLEKQLKERITEVDAGFQFYSDALADA